jgi:hypothetical protein
MTASERLAGRKPARKGRMRCTNNYRIKFATGVATFVFAPPVFWWQRADENKRLPLRDYQRSGS